MYFSFIVVSTTVCSFLYSLVAVASPAPASARAIATATNATSQNAIPTASANGGCSCAVYLREQFVKGSRQPPSGYPPITAEPEETFACTPAGVRQCTTKCLENAYLFVKNCNSEWINTHMSAGREFCCKNNEYYKCPNVAA